MPSKSDSISLGRIRELVEKERARMGVTKELNPFLITVVVEDSLYSVEDVEGNEYWIERGRLQGYEGVNKLRWFCTYDTSSGPIPLKKHRQG